MSRWKWLGLLGALCVTAGLAWATDDFALFTTYYGTVSYMALDGTVPSTPPVTVNSPTQVQYGSYGIGIGDFDNDGLDDYVMGGYSSTNYLARVEFHKRTGPDNSFAPGVAIAGTGGWYYYVTDFAVADYNSDGNLDFAVGDFQSQVHVYFGHGDGTFEPGPSYPIPFYAFGMDAADVNNDGHVDFVVNRYYDSSVYSCYYTYPSPYGGYYYSYYACDSSSTTRRIAVFLGDGHGGFTESTETMHFATLSSTQNSIIDYSWGIALADFDGDGKIDAALDSYAPYYQDGKALLVFRGNGDGTFATTPIYTGPTTDQFEFASLDNDDVNHDGIQDLIYAPIYGAQVTTYLGVGDGTFTAGSAVAEPYGTYGVSTRPGTAAADHTPPSVTLDPTPALTNSASLHVTGTASDSGGISQVQVVLGGNVVATPVIGANGAVSATVTLAEGANDVALRATDHAGNPGESAHRTVVLDTTPPATALGTLPHFVTDASFVLTGTASDANGIASIAIVENGVQATSVTPDAGGTFSAPLTLAEGTNTLEVVVTDAAGNHASVSGQIILDTAGPDIALAALPDFTNAAAQTITGTAHDAYGIAQLVLTVDGAQVGVPFTPAADGSFHVDVTLAEGTNTIAIQATNLAGLTSSAHAGTVLDTIPPSATLASMPAYTNIATLGASGVIGDSGSGIASAVLRVVGGASSPTLVPDASGNVSATLPLTEGPQTIVLEARDRAGNVGATSAELTLDTTPPTVAITSPAGGQPFGVTTVPVGATVTDATPTTLTFGSLQFHLDAGGGLGTGNVDLGAEGPATITVIAVDAAGNIGTAQVGVVVDLTAPVADLDLGGLADGANIGPQPADQLLYTLHVDDLTQVAMSASWDSTFAYSFAAGGGVLQGAVPLSEGHDVFEAHLTDAVGHETVVTRTVTYDITPPVASVTGVLATPGSPVRGTVELAGAATDNLTGVATVVFDVDGTHLAATASADSFIASLDTTTLTDGIHDVHATFTDGVGNVRTLASTLLVDNTAPTVSVDSPASGAYVRQTVSITASAGDATSGVAGIDVAVNGATVGHCPASPCTVSFDTTALANGPFLVTASARDAAGNGATSADRSAIADNSAPSKFLVSPIAGAVLKSSMTVSVNVTDDYFAQVECTVDGTSLGVSTAPQATWTVNLLTKLDGPVTVSCTARDLAGNVGTESATVRIQNWKLELEPRTLSLRSEGEDVELEIEGPNVSTLLPVESRGLALVVAGGSPVPLVARRGGYQIESETENGVTRQELELKFDRKALVAAIKAGIAAGTIDASVPVTVRLVAGNRTLDTQTLRAQAKNR